MFSHLRPFTAARLFPSGFPTALFYVLMESPFSKYRFPAKEIKYATTVEIKSPFQAPNLSTVS